MALGSAGISIRPIEKFTVDQLWGLMYAVEQSSRVIAASDTLRFTVTYVEVMKGRGAGGANAIRASMLKSRSIVHIGNTDNLCFPRSLVVARVNNKQGADRCEAEWYRIRHKASKTQREEALRLVECASVKIPSEGCGDDEIKAFQDYYIPMRVAIVVYDWETLGQGAEPLFDGTLCFENIGGEENETPLEILNIAYSDSLKHYSPITNLCGAAGGRNYCIPCNKSFRRENEHRCLSKCPRCFNAPPCVVDIDLKAANETLAPAGAASSSRQLNATERYSGGEVEAVDDDDERLCDNCGRLFFNALCFENHLKPRANRRQADKRERASICDTIRVCKVCGKTVRGANSGRTHECGVVFCKICKHLHGSNEYCYMHVAKPRAIKQSKDSELKHPDTLFIFYDFETRQDELYYSGKVGQGEAYEHVVTLCVAHQVCDYCLDMDDNARQKKSTTTCLWCGVSEYVFRQDPVSQLVDLAVRRETKFRNIVCIAHNAKSFDAQFILRNVVDRLKDMATPSIILTGNSIISMRIGRTVFIDSLNYFHMRLADLPKSFGFDEKIGKGYFPHLFNTKDVSTGDCALPAAEYYSPGTMSVEGREKFYVWYEEQVRQNKTFNFDEEIVKYCKMDVEILRRACCEFRKIFLQVGNVCPFTEAVTIASACSLVFRRNFLKPQTIGVIPAGGYRRAENHSQQAVDWLLWVEHEVGQEIQHVARGREYRLVEGPRVDGYRMTDGKEIVYQFHGCYWHGCVKCFPNNRARASGKNDESLDARYARTSTISREIRSYGYELVEKWECAFKAERSQNPKINEFLNNHPRRQADCLNPRDAFFGGRTGNIVTAYDVKQGEKISYIDVCSLYPYICKTGRFPVGHPTIYVGSECDSLLADSFDAIATTVNGLIKCTILPPRDLFHPVLPVRAHNKLLFALCRKCVEEACQCDCPHDNPDDRAFTGTWVTDEVRKALDVGYKIVKIQIIWSYSTTQYNPDTREGGLFVEYINAFLRIKQESSGPPRRCVDEPTLTEYIEGYERAEGIVLNRANIKKNPGLRSVAKLCLNSFWGKFGQRDNLTRTEIVKTRQKLLALLYDNTIEVNRLLPVNDDVMYVNWQSREECVEVNAQTNVVIAAFTTALARLKLYSYLERLDRRVLYYDTDSVIYKSSGSPDEWVPQLGDLLGDMTDELAGEGENAYINSFVSGGPKFYGYTVVTSEAPATVVKSVCKVKGLSLNYDNSRLINYSSIRDLILSDLPEENDESIRLHFPSIDRTPLHKVITRTVHKTCRVVCRKRRHITHRLSLPFGYKHLNES